jgi:ferric-dicitrate binding protein FerR (iron transport regulator)
VLVAQGTVRVESPGAGPRSDGHAAASEMEPARLVSAGQRVEVQRGSNTPPRIEEMSEEETARIGAWQPTRLDFSSAPLKAAVSEFNRRNRVQFVIADPELESLSIAASIRSDNIRGFEHFLAGIPGVVVERASETEIVLHRRK